MNIETVIKAHDRLIQKYARSYCPYYHQRDDFAQELRIKLWKALRDIYDPKIGCPTTFVKYTLLLWARRLRYDEPVQSKFENHFFYTDVLPSIATVYYAPYEELDFKKWITFINKHLNFSERRVFSVLIRYCREDKPIVYKKIAEELSINRLTLYKNLSSIRSKISAQFPV